MIAVVACGAVVWRRSFAGGPEVLVVHRPRYDDWSFAKGKLEPGETLEECARREVHEETGLTVTLGHRLPDVSYIDRKGRPKTVHYWIATTAAIDADRSVGAAAGSFVANDEVDELRWVAPSEASALLSYPRDAELLSAFTTVFTEELTEDRQ